jgi:hypothetical protein
LIAIECHQNGRARCQSLHVTRDTRYFYQILLAKRLLKAQKETGKKILGDVAECDSQHQSNQARPAKHRQRELGKPGNTQHKVQAGKHHEHAAGSGHYFP